MGTAQSISGFVLAGGASRRMGQPKQHLLLGSETMLARQVRLLRSVCRPVSVVGPGVGLASSEVEFLADAFPGRGPLGGIHAALAAARTEFSLIVACDMPFLEQRFLCNLVQRAISSKADVTIPEDKARRLLPVCAVYRKRVQVIIRARLAGGLNKADGYFRDVELDPISWSETLRAGFSPHIFDNINRPEDFEEARRRLGV
jgi:molybdenum cofactor guanylyltransferase